MLDNLHHSPIGTPHTTTELTHNTGNQATGGIWTLTGPGGTAVLKHLTPTGDGNPSWPASTDPRHWNYWKREHLAYTTGATTHYGAEAGISAPRLLAEGTRPDGSIELWLEHLTGTPGFDWTIDQLTDLTHRLGQIQARPAPDQPWHSRQFLRTYAGRHHFDTIAWDHPLAAQHWPQPLIQGLRTIWEQRNTLFTITETAPQTLCHLDVWSNNLTRTNNGSALLDWSFLGQGATGEDPANLIADTFLDGLWPTTRLAETETRLTDAYLTGLGHTGPKADHTRKTIAAAGAAKYCWLAPMMLNRLATNRPTASANYDTETDDATILQRRRPVFAMLVRWAQTALNT